MSDSPKPTLVNRTRSFRDRVVTVSPGEMLLVARGMEHRPVARKSPVQLNLIDSNGTPDNGDTAGAAHAVESRA